MQDKASPIQNERLTAVELFPWLNTKAVWLKSRTFWLVVAITVLAVLLFSSNSSPRLLIDSLAAIILVTYVLVLRHFLRSDISLLTLGGVFLFVVVLMKVPFLPVPGQNNLVPPLALWLWFWRYVLPGNALETASFLPFDWLRSLASDFFSAGLAEDSFKILPVAMAIFARRWLLQRPADQAWAGAWAKRLDMSRPTTMLMVCFASAAAFVYLETVGQYVPDKISEVSKAFLVYVQGLPGDAQSFFSEQAGIVQGLQLLVPRLLTFLTGHGAYAAIAGFGLVLARRHPRNAAQAVISLLATSALLHASWNTFASQDELSIPIGLAAGFAMLTVCLRCMELDGEGNFQAGLAIGGSIVPQRKAPPIPQPAAQPAQPAFSTIPKEPVILGALVLQADSGEPVTIFLRPGAQISLASAAAHWPQLTGASLEVLADPAQPTRFGLKNTGSIAWAAIAPDGREGQVEPGRIMGLLAGARMEIAGVKGRLSLVS